MPAGTVGETYHEVVVAGINVGWNLDIVLGGIGALPGGDGEVLIVDPGVDGLLGGFHGALHGRGAVGVMVEIVVNLDVVGAQLGVVGEQIAEGNDLAASEDVTVGRYFHNVAGVDDGIGHVFRVVIGTAARTECAQQC